MDQGGQGDWCVARSLNKAEKAIEGSSMDNDSNKTSGFFVYLKGLDWKHGRSTDAIVIASRKC